MNIYLNKDLKSSTKNQTEPIKSSSSTRYVFWISLLGLGTGWNSIKLEWFTTVTVHIKWHNCIMILKSTTIFSYLMNVKMSTWIATYRKFKHYLYKHWVTFDELESSMITYFISPKSTKLTLMIIKYNISSKNLNHR